jgi:uncharacterized membrane protein
VNLFADPKCERQTPLALRQRSAIVSVDTVWIGAILVLACVLRVIRLDASLWYDEIDTLVHEVRLPFGHLTTHYPSLNHHVLYSLEARVCVLLFGESAWAVRLPAFFFGVASIWALWLLAQEITSPWVARLSALLLAVSYHHIWFSQNARGYTGILFWCLIATYLFIRGWKESSWQLWALYGVVMALALYTHLSAIFFFAAQSIVYIGLVAYYYFFRRQGSRMGLSGALPLLGFAAGGLGAALLHAPLIPDMIATFSEVAGPQPEADAAAAAHWKSPLWMILEVGRSLSAQPPVLAIAIPAILIVTVAGILRMGKTAPLVPIMALVHILLTLAFLVALSFRIWPRYFFVDIAFICLFLVEGAFFLGAIAALLLQKLKFGTPQPHTLGLAFALLGVAASLAILPRNYLYPKQDFLGARDFIEANRSPESVVLTLGLATMPYAEYYAPAWKSVETISELEAVQQSNNDVWVVYSFPAVTARRYKDLTNYLASHFEARRFSGTLGDGDVLVFRSKPQGANDNDTQDD